MTKRARTNLGSETVRDQMEKQPWDEMELFCLGDAAELIKSGGGKLSTAGGDPGESRKETGND